MLLSRIETFVRVAECGSFTAAAKQLGIPTSSVSRAIGSLEAELGGKLLARTTRSMSLTQLGHMYLHHASRALAELADAERRAGELQRVARGEIRIAAPADLDDGTFASTLAAFVVAYPSIRVTCVLSNAYADLVADGIDLAMRVADELPDSSLIARPLGTYRAHLVASEAYLERRKAPRTVAELARHECVLLSARAHEATWELSGPQGVQTVRVRGRVIASDLAFARQLILGGAGIGVAATAPGSAPATDARLVRVLPAWELRAPTLFLVEQTRRPPARVALLRDHLLTAYARPPARHRPIS